MANKTRFAIGALISACVVGSGTGIQSQGCVEPYAISVLADVLAKGDPRAQYLAEFVTAVTPQD